MNEIELLSSILEQVTYISSFLQFLIYGLVILVIIYYGYWFFSRFFY